jgi:hypothetical protein
VATNRGTQRIPGETQVKNFFRRALSSGFSILPALAIPAILSMLAGLSACGGSSATPPPVPTGLAATGALGVIRLSWTSGGPMVGHNIYRSTDNVTFSKRNGATVGGTSYNDTIASPDGDGIFYYYRITAVDSKLESAPSGTVRAIHGTRLAAAYSAGFRSDNAALSPYVLDGGSVVDNGIFLIQTGDKLYLLDNAVLDLEQGNDVTVHGLLRVLAASGASHATITSHRVAGSLALGEGFSMTFFTPDDFNPADNSGTWIRNTLLSNLKSGQAFSISACSPRFENCRAIANDNIGTSYLSIHSGAGPVIRNCAFDNMTLEIADGAPSATFAFDHNLFTNSYYSVSFWNIVGPAVSSGQIANNVFVGGKPAYLWNATGGPIPMDNNFWNTFSYIPGTTLVGGSTTTSYSFLPALTTAPSSAGPDW